MLQVSQSICTFVSQSQCRQSASLPVKGTFTPLSYTILQLSGLHAVICHVRVVFCHNSSSFSLQ